MGYSPSFLWNLTPILYILLTLFIIWLSLILGQLIFRNKLGESHKFTFFVHQSLNILVRLAYAAFLEVAICTLLALTLAYYVADFFIALVASWLVIVSICLVVVLFFKGGPKDKAGRLQYEKCSLWSCLLCW